MKNRNPAVSVVMPAFNAERFVDQAIGSVLRQSLEDWELIIINDASRDRTAEIIARHAAADPRVVIVSHECNLGVAAARNRGLDLARGRYVAFLDSDDMWLPHKLTAQVAFLDRTKGVVSYGSYRRIDESGRPVGFVEAVPRLDYPTMLRANFVGNLTGIFRREPLADLRFERIGHEDYVFWLAAISRCGAAYATPSSGPLAEYRVTANSLSGNKLKAACWQWNIYRNRLGFSWWRSVGQFASYAYFSVLKRWR